MRSTFKLVLSLFFLVLFSKAIIGCKGHQEEKHITESSSHIDEALIVEVCTDSLLYGELYDSNESIGYQLPSGDDNAGIYDSLTVNNSLYISSSSVYFKYNPFIVVGHIIKDIIVSRYSKLSLFAISLQRHTDKNGMSPPGQYISSNFSNSTKNFNHVIFNPQKIKSTA
jgi:hypothetical protein